MSMKDRHQIRLIDGEFDPRDALQIIDTLLEAKIKFHSSKRFAHSVRGTEDRVGCSQRIAELQDARRRFASYMRELPANVDRIAVEGLITLRPMGTSGDAEGAVQAKTAEQV